MNELFIDFETFASKTVSLRRMTLRQYLSRTHVTGFAFAANGDEVEFVVDIDDDLFALLTTVAESDDWIVVAHNAPFDMRVWHYLVGLPWPKRIRCSMGLARAAWPCQPGTRPYALASLATYLGLGTKGTFDVTEDEHTGEEFEAYNKHDVELCRGIYRAAVPRVSEDDLAIAELCHRTRSLRLTIDRAKQHEGLTAFIAEAEANAEKTMLAIAGVEDVRDVPPAVRDAFGWDGSKVKSVKPHQLKALLMDEFGFDTDTISLKKIAPGRLARSPEARGVLTSASATNRMLSHARRTAVFAGLDAVDVELNEFAAHTFRFASSSVGRGVNLLNLPKHDKAVAKPIRSMFRLDADHAWARADAANVEYRLEGWLTGCDYTRELFDRDPLADPYSAFGEACTGSRCDRDDPIRQIWKASVLGLGFIMGDLTFISTLMQAVGKGWVSVEAFADLAKAQGWGPSFGRRGRSIHAHMTKIDAPLPVAVVAHHARELFHRIHPEFARLGHWLYDLCEAVASARDPAVAIERAFDKRTAPDRTKLNVSVDTGLEGRSLRVQVGHWEPTLVWRDIATRMTKYGIRLTSLAGGSKGYRALTPSILIENVTQACARNAICKLMLQLAPNYPRQMCVHDEIMLHVRRTPADLLAAREALIRLGGPGNALGYGPAFLLNPDEITVSESWYDGGVDWPAFWASCRTGVVPMLP